MSYLDEIINRALQRVRQNLKPKFKYAKRVRNRQKLYDKRLRLGRVKK